MSNTGLENDYCDGGGNCFVHENAGVKWDADVFHIVCSFSVTIVTVNVV